MADAISTDSAAALGRWLVRTAPHATLATRDPNGWPHAALVLAACDHDASPLLLLSDLAEHTRQLRADPRVALLFHAAPGQGDPLSGSRCTVLGPLQESVEPRHRRRVLARHPHAAAYAGFADFRLYRLEVQRAHVIAGFARAARIDGAAWRALPGGAAEFASAEADIVSRINDIQPEVPRRAATRLLGLPDGPWQVTGMDPEGCDLRLGAQAARLEFGCRFAEPGEAAAELSRRAGVERGGPRR